MSESAPTSVPSTEPSPSLSPPPARRSRAPLILLLMLIAIGVGVYFWMRHSNSPDYKAQQRMDEARAHEKRGDLVAAAEMYREVGLGRTRQAAPATDSFKRMLSTLDNAPFAVTAQLYRLAYDWPDRPDMRNGLFERGRHYLQQRANDDPRGAITLYEVLHEMAETPEQQTELSHELGRSLKTWHEKDPHDVYYATRYANYLGTPSIDDTKGIIKVLEPHTFNLGVDDGARLLGQAYAREGNIGPALTLLEPYCRIHLKQLLEIEEKVRKIQDSAEKTEEAQMRLLVDPEMQRLRARHLQHRGVVSALMELSRLYVRRARTQVNPADRLADLKSAKEKLLSLRETDAGRVVAGFGTELRFGLAGIALLTGDTAESQKHFTEVLDAFRKTAREHQDLRAPHVLMRGASIFRSLGEPLEARRLTEEAYQLSQEFKDERGQEEFAYQRSRLAVDTEDELIWLEKCDKKKPAIQVALLKAQGERARQKGRLKDAEVSYRQAAEIVATLPKNADTFLEGGLAWLRVFQVTGDKAAMDKGISLLEDCITVQANNLDLIASLLGPLRETACRDLVIDSIDLNALRRPASLDYFAFLYADKEGREQQVANLRKHPGFQRVRTHAEKLLEYKPAQPDVLFFLAALYVLDRDERQLNRLAADVNAADIDYGAALWHLSNRYAGKIDERQKKERQVQLERWEERVQELRKKRPDRTLAVALTGLGNTMLSGEVLGESIDAERAVKLAEDARSATVCRATTEQLVAALLHRAHRQLSEREADYRKMSEKVRHVLDSSYSIAVALTREETTKAVAAHPDVVRACQLLKEIAEAFPDEPKPWLWAMLHRTHPETATKLAAALKTDPIMQSLRAISLKLKPLSLDTALDEYWTLRLDNPDGKLSKEILRKLSQRGVPLPFAVD